MATRFFSSILSSGNSFLHQWFRLGSHWQNLGRLFSATATRLFVTWFAAVPVALKLLDSVPESVALPTTPPIQLTLGLPFNWWLLWFASLSYAVSYALYTVFCPRFLKQYKDYEQYSSKGHSPRWLVWEFSYSWKSISDTEKLKLLERCSAKGLVTEFNSSESEATPPSITDEPSVASASTDFVFKHLDKIYTTSASEKLCEQKVKEIFWEVFGRWSSSRFRIRVLAWGLFWIAVGLTLLVTLQNIWFALSQLLNK